MMRVSVSRNNPQVMQIGGEIDYSSADQFYNFLAEAVAKRKRSLILNLKDLNYLDSAGLQTLFRLWKKLSKHGRKIILVNPKPGIRRLLEISGFSKFLPVIKTEKEALSLFNAGKTGNVMNTRSRKPNYIR